MSNSRTKYAFSLQPLDAMDVHAHKARFVRYVETRKEIGRPYSASRICHFDKDIENNRECAFLKKPRKLTKQELALFGLSLFLTPSSNENLALSLI